MAVDLSYVPFQSVSEQLDKVKTQLQEELKNVSSLKAKVSELEVCLFPASSPRLHYTQLH